MNEDEDFLSRAMASVSRQAASGMEPFARSLVESEVPKIDSAVKAYMSLVAARSAVDSSADVIILEKGKGGRGDDSGDRYRCSFVQSPNRSALLCARSLLATINSTAFPKRDTEQKNVECESLEKDAICILWNGLVKSDRTNKIQKPSKLLGRKCLEEIYPFILGRFRAGISSSSRFDNERKSESGGNPVPVPIGVMEEEWEAFYEEFGDLLFHFSSSRQNESEQKDIENSSECPQGRMNEYKGDDSALLWAKDSGFAELQRRRAQRLARANKAVGSST